jgi:hypothetical protein
MGSVGYEHGGVRRDGTGTASGLRVDDTDGRGEGRMRCVERAVRVRRAGCRKRARAGVPTSNLDVSGVERSCGAFTRPFASATRTQGE